MRHFLITCGLLLMCFPAAAQAAAPQYALFTNYTAHEFRKLPAAQKEINVTKFEEELLSAAIFHESNARRAQHKLPTLIFEPRVRFAALKHARSMAKVQVLTHGSPKKGKTESTPYGRLLAEGLKPRYVAENIAFTFALRYKSGTPMYTWEEAGKTRYSLEPGGKQIPPHTYQSFAESIVTQWMNSAPHRANLLAKEPRYLGIGSAVAKDAKGFDTIYGAQKFYTPLESGMPWR